MAAVSSTLLSPTLSRLAPSTAPGPGEGVTAAPATLTTATSRTTRASASPALAESAVAAPTAAVAPADAARTTANKPLSKEEIAKQVHELQTKMDKLNPALTFVLDQDSGRALMQLTDRATKEVILQFPSEAALQISKALDQFQKGQLLSRTV